MKHKFIEDMKSIELNITFIHTHEHIYMLLETITY